MDQQFKTLTSLAILKVDLDQGFRDYLDYLISFASHVLNTNKPDPVTDEKLCDLLKQEFGLNVPKRGCQLVLRRLVKQHYLKRESNVYSIEKKLPQIDFSIKKNQAQNDIDIVYRHLKQYAEEHFNVDWKESDLTRAIFGFLSKFGIDFLRAYVFKTALPEVPPSAPTEQYVVSKFISNLYERHDPVFESISVLVKGQMYANALVCPDLESLQKKFNNLTFYIDTALVLNLLGLQGKEEQSAIEELFALIKQLHGKVAVFDHTVEEVINVITGAEKNIDNANAKGRVIREIRRSGIKRTDLILMKDHVREELNNRGILQKATPEYKMDFQVSETELEGAISDEIDYRNPDAITFDINSVRSIYVLRAGKVPKRLEDAVAVFVTPNSLLAKAAFNVGQNHNSTREVSSVITDYSLTNIAWLKAPLGAPELPTKELLATCYAALEPSYSLWDKYLEEIGSLMTSGQITPDDHALLRVSPLAADELMNLTLGEESALTGGSVREILDRVKRELTAEKDSELAQEKEKMELISEELGRLKDKEEVVGSNVYWLAGKIAKSCSITLGLIVVLLLLIGLFYSSWNVKSFPSDNPITNYFIYSIILLSVVWGISNWVFGMTIQDILNKTEKSIHQYVFNLLSKQLKRKR